jgi:hypothetical protein
LLRGVLRASPLCGRPPNPSAVRVTDFKRSGRDKRIRQPIDGAERIETDKFSHVVNTPLKLRD